MPEAEIYRSVLAADIAVLQAKAGKELIEGIEQDDRSKELAAETARDAAVLNFALKVFEDMRNPEKELQRVTLEADAPVLVEPAETKT